MELSTRDVEFLESLKTPTVADRAVKILREMERQSDHINSRLNFNFSAPETKEWMGVSWSCNLQEVDFLVTEYLHGLGFINGSSLRTFGGGVLGNAGITPRGYELLEQLRQGGEDSQIAFCAMWFTPETEPLWESTIEPSILMSGHQPLRIDQHEHLNRIDDEIIACLRRSKFVIADFTGQRGGVYFEAGFALGLGLRVIWTCREDALSGIHFDNRQYNFLTWKIDALPDFATRLKNRIEATIGRGPIRS